MRKIGLEMLTHKLGATTLDKHGDYELLTFNLGLQKGPVKALKMLNPSVPDLWHVEFVSHECETVHHALNFRNGRTIERIADE